MILLLSPWIRSNQSNYEDRCKCPTASRSVVSTECFGNPELYGEPFQEGIQSIGFMTVLRWHGNYLKIFEGRTS